MDRGPQTTEHISAGVSPEEGNKDDQRAGTHLLRRKAERVGLVEAFHSTSLSEEVRKGIFIRREVI